MIYLADVLKAFSYLIGESSVPSSNIDDRTFFAQDSLAQIYRMYPWSFDKVIAQVPLTNGQGSIPTDAAQDPELDVRVVGAGSHDDHIFTQVDYNDFDSYGQGSYVYYIKGYAGAYTIVTSETTTTSVTLRYDQVEPTLSATIASPFPSAKAVAMGMLPHYRQARDPEYDVSQDIDLFEREVKNVWARHNRNNPRKRIKSIYEVRGTYVGDID